AALSARALDPVLPHVAADFSVSIATAASFAAAFAFTFAIIQPVLGAMADMFGKARLMIVCLVLLGLANILGAMATSFPLLFASRILAGIGSGGLFPFLAAFLFELGETSLSIAGIVIAGFAVGGLFYTMTVSRFLPRIGVNGMMIGGATLVGVQLIAVAMGPEWRLQTLSLIFMGWGFYMIHGSLQVFASELSAEARATALSL